MAAAAKEDTWAFQPIGAPFPENPIRVRGHNNQYVALWYKHGKPVNGRAWSNGGVVECSFPFNGKELTGQRDLGGDIQILTYPAPDQWEGFPKVHYWYDWVPYAEYRDRLNKAELLRCGQSTPVLIKSKKGEELVGNLDLNSEVAQIPYDGKAEQLAGSAQLKNAWVIMRILVAPPPPLSMPKVMEDQWMDLRVNDPFPAHAVRALDRQLKQEDGSNMDQSVALWYKHGEPVMGRCWRDGAGKVQAMFGWDGKEFGGIQIGSMQLLVYNPDGRMGFDYRWLTFSEAAASYRRNDPNSFQPVHVGDCAPCVVRTPQGHERLGKVLLSQEKAGAAFNGKEEIFTGPTAAAFLVLCRKPPGQRK